MAGLLLAVCCGLWHGAAQAVPSGNVLVLYSAGRLLPANTAFDRGLTEGLSERRDVDASLFSEFLDAPTFGGEAYEKTLASYLHEKYASRPPSVIVAGGPEALGFALRRREQLFTGAPVLYVAVPEEALRALGPLPGEVFGLPLR